MSGKERNLQAAANLPIYQPNPKATQDFNHITWLFPNYLPTDQHQNWVPFKEGSPPKPTVTVHPDFYCIIVDFVSGSLLSSSSYGHVIFVNFMRRTFLFKSGAWGAAWLRGFLWSPQKLISVILILARIGKNWFLSHWNALDGWVNLIIGWRNVGKSDHWMEICGRIWSLDGEMELNDETKFSEQKLRQPGGLPWLPSRYPWSLQCCTKSLLFVSLNYSLKYK